MLEAENLTLSKWNGTISSSETYTIQRAMGLVRPLERQHFLPCAPQHGRNPTQQEEDTFLAHLPPSRPNECALYLFNIIPLLLGYYEY